MQELINNINIELQKLEAGQPVALDFKAPRIGSAIDKKTRIAKETALCLFPIEDNGKTYDVEKTHSYIRYCQLIKRITDAQKEQSRQIKYYNEMYRNAKANRETFEKLLGEPIKSPILNPTPMPVDIAPLDELAPFFEHMASNKPCSLGHKEFTRGAYYDDGRIDMCKQVVGPTYIGALVDSIRQNPHVKHFLMGNNIADYKCAEKISSFILNDHPHIETWYLAGNCIDSKGMKLLAEALETDMYCKALWLKRNPLHVEGVKYLATMLEKNSTIEILDLHNTCVMDEGIKYLFESLKKNNTLRLLYLDANGITAVGARYIADYFNYLVEHDLLGITSLYLSMNRLGDEGANIIADSLVRYNHLERLNIASNRIQRSGLTGILNALEKHEHLKVLSIGLYKSTADMMELPNCFDDSYDLIANFIRGNKYVQVLDINNTLIPAPGLLEILDAFETNSTILYLYYEQYGYCMQKAIHPKFRAIMDRNINNKLNIGIDEFQEGYLRVIKHTDRIKDIDSIYRNAM